LSLPAALLRFPAAVERDLAIEAWFGRRAGQLSALARPWYACAT
jgi:hypothetical protein